MSITLRRLTARSTTTLALAAALGVSASVGCSSSAEPANPVVPQLTAIDPPTVVAGATALELTVTGSYFVPRSIVRIEGVDAPTTFVSATELRAQVSSAILATAGGAAVVVVTPPPGGGTSSALTLSRNNSIPTLTGLIADTATAGGGARTVEAVGTLFSPLSVVEWMGTSLQTEFVSVTRLRFTLTLQQRSIPGEFSVRVRNPAPGGGLSEALPFFVYGLVPDLLPPAVFGLAAGGSDFEMYLDGRRFEAGAEVRWNGVARPATRITPTRLSITVSAADVSAPGAVTLQAVNPAHSFQSARESEVRAMTIRSVGPATATVNRTLVQGAKELAWDPAGQRFYVSVSEFGGPLRGTISSFDVTGIFRDSVRPIDPVNSMLLTADNQHLYVGAAGTNTHLLRYSVPSLVLDWSMRLEPVIPLYLTPVRWRPDAIGYLSGIGDVATQFSVLLPTGVHDLAGVGFGEGPNVIAFAGSDSVFYGYSAHANIPRSLKAWITPSGHMAYEVVDGGPNGDGIQGVGNRLISVHGGVIDPERRLVERNIGPGGSFAVDRETGRVYVLSSGEGVRVYDFSSSRLLGTIVIPEANNSQRTRVILRWGTDGLALVTGSHLIVLQSPIVAP